MPKKKRDPRRKPTKRYASRSRSTPRTPSTHVSGPRERSSGLLPGGKQVSLFAAHPLRIEGFLLKARRVEPVGRPTLPQWAAAMQLAYAAEESSGFWIGDLWNYAEDRAEWRETLPQALADIGLDVAQQTLYNYGSIARRVKAQARAVAPSHSHAREVAALDDDEQVDLLEEASEKGWTRRDLHLNIRARKRPTILTGQATLEGRYRVLYADPPWAYNDRGDIVVGKSSAYKRAEAHYPTMTIAELCKLPVAAHALPHSVLFCWVTAPMLYAQPGPREVIDAWGFSPKTGLVWDKVLGNFGHYVRACHEHVIIATRGRCVPDEPTPQPDSVQTIRRGDIHSEKPEAFRQIITKLYTQGPYLELFGRKPVQGWDVFGNDARLWAQDAARSA